MNGIYSLKHVARTMNQGGPVKFKEPLQRDFFSPKLTSVAKQLPALAKKIPGPVGRGAAILEGLGQLPLIYDRISFSDPDEMGFRSVAEDVMGLPSFPNKGTAKQMEAALGQGKTKSLPKPVVAQIGNRKIDKEELKFLGITDLLEEAKRTGQPVTKEQIQNAIESNRSNMYLKQEVLEELPDESILSEMDDPNDPTKTRIEVIDNEGLGVGVFARGTDEDSYWAIVVDGEISGSVSNENEARVRLIQEASEKGIRKKGAKHRNEVAEDYDMGDIGRVEKYREIKVRLPEEAGGDIDSHYGDDVAYHMRVSDREYTRDAGKIDYELGISGKMEPIDMSTTEEVLYVDEIQSDYAQAGAGRKPYLELAPLIDDPVYPEVFKLLTDKYGITKEQIKLATRLFSTPEGNEAREAIIQALFDVEKDVGDSTIRNQFKDVEFDEDTYGRENQSGLVNLRPDDYVESATLQLQAEFRKAIKKGLKEQPLVAGQEKWVQHAIKSLITRMVNEGKDRLIFTSGKNQADYWNEEGLEKFYDVRLKKEVKDVLKGIDKDAFEMVEGLSGKGMEPFIKHISIKNTQKIRDFLEGVGGKPRGFGGYAKGGEVETKDIEKLLKPVAKSLPGTLGVGAKVLGTALSLPYSSVPVPASESEMFGALKSNQKEKINAPLPEGQKIGLRLDIPAYREHNVWVPTLKPLEGEKQLTSHRATAAIKNADLNLSESIQKKAKKVKEGSKKGPFAVIEGEFIDRTDEENYRLAQQYLSDPEWVQVGYNPEKHAYFFDRETDEPVINGEEAIQVGPLVLVKNPVFGRREDFLYAKGGGINSMKHIARNMNGGHGFA